MIGCSEQAAQLGQDASVAAVDAAPDSLVLSLSIVGDSGARYPYDPSTNSHRLYTSYESRLQNYTKEDLQDLKLQILTPDAYKKNATIKIEGGYYNGALGHAEVLVDWLPTGSGALKNKITMDRDPNLFGDDSAFARGEALRGEVKVSTTARVSQYDQVVATASAADTTYYLPNKVAPQPFDFYSGQRDGDYVYVSGRTRDTPADAGIDDNRFGYYRINLTSGVTEAIAFIAVRADAWPFWVAEQHIYFVNWTDTNGQQRPSLYRVDKNAIKSTPQLLSLPDGVTEILGIRSNTTHIYVTLRTNNGPYSVYRFSANDPKSGVATSPTIGRPIPDTLAITSTQVIALLEDPPSMLRFPLDLSTATKMTDTSSSAGRRTLACSETRCFWVQWVDPGMYEVAISATAGTDAGAPAVKKISGTNQSILFDGKHLYSGINGLIRVGPSGNPAEERLFSGGLPPMLGSDNDYVYFGYDSHVWKLHK